MSYEHRLIIGEITEISENYTSFSKIADLKMSRMHTDFERIFKEKVNFRVYESDGETEITHDRYGDRITYAAIDDVIDSLQAEISSNTESIHRRYKPTLEYLKLLKQETATDASYSDSKLIVIHYGY